MTTSRTVLTVRTPAELLPLVPHLVGHVPHESLVLLALHDQRRRVGVVLRVDLPPARSEKLLARQLAGSCRRAGGREILAVVYTAGGGAGTLLPRRRLVTVLDAAVSERGLPLIDALLVAGDRWWSYRCAEPACCPPGGSVVPDAAAAEVAAAFALEGRAVLPDRAALVASVAPHGPVNGVQRHVDRLAGEAPVTPAGTVGLWSSQVRRWPAERALSDEVVARLLVGFQDVLARDAVLVRCGGAHRDAEISLLLELTRRAPPPLVAPVASVLAWCAYAAGDGGLANVAVDRALAADPAYSLARLVREAGDAAVAPRALRSAARDAAPAVARLLPG